MSLTTVITAVLPTTDEWFIMCKRYNTLLERDKELPDALLDYFCCEEPDSEGKEMLVYLPFTEEFDEDLCETTFRIKATHLPENLIAIRINQSR